MKPTFSRLTRRPLANVAFLFSVLLSLLTTTTGHADSAATVAGNANTLINTAAVQSSPYSLTTGYSPLQLLTLSNAEKWTNLPGTPPGDGARIGPVIGGGSVSYTTYELSSTVSSGYSVSPRAAALTLAASTTSTAGATELNEIRYADSVLSASGGGTAYNYSDYRVDVLSGATTATAPTASTDFIVKFAGHHLAYNFTYNFPTFNGSKAYLSASPMFLGLEPPDYQSTGTDNQGSTSATASNAFIPCTNNGTAGSFLALYPGTNSTSLTTITAAAAATSLPARTNVTATAISGATSASYTISSATASDNGFYFCKASNGSGSTNSNTVALTIALNANGSLYQNTSAITGSSGAPSITTQPASATVTTGSSVTFSVVASGATSYQWYKIATTHRAAMEAQRSAASNLAAAVQADSTLKSSALLSGTFSDIVMGVGGSSGDTNYPFTSGTEVYPTGTSGRGVLFSSLTTAQQTTLKPLIKAFIEAYVNNASADSAPTLLADYESDAAINATYVGYQVGSGSATGGSTATCNFDATVNQEQTPVNTQHSYIRVDGPRAWVEMVAQGAVLYNTQKFVHYHSIYRDRLSDYGGEFGSFLNGASTASGYTGTTYTRPSFTTQPTSVTGSSATFTAVATANTAGAAVTPAYQWYNSAGAISGATSASHTTSTVGSYYVTATTAYGSTASSKVTLVEPFAAYLSTYGLTGTDPTVDSDGDGISNLLEFVLGGNPTMSDTSILPVSSYTASSGTPSLLVQFYTVANLGSATWTLETSPDLLTWTTAVNGTNGVAITTTAYNASYNYTVATIPNPTGGSLFARLRASLPSTYVGSQK